MAVKRLEAEHAVSLGMTLGEGPIWVGRERALWFVDIKQQLIYRYDPGARAIQSWKAPDQVGWVLPSEDGAFLAGLASGLYRFNPIAGTFSLYREVEPHPPCNRLNDAASDCEGRVWFGSMDDGEKRASGRLYLLHRGTVADTGLEPIPITNGPAISPDGRTLYAVDTLGRSIDAFTIGTGGTLEHRRRFLSLATGDSGFPDGVTCDAEGGLWLGLFGGWSARRYAPSGALTHEVRFPVSNVTKIALGGSDGRTAYATTAKLGLDEAALAKEPFAGDIFTFRVDTPAAPAIPVALD